MLFVTGCLFFGAVAEACFLAVSLYAMGTIPFQDDFSSRDFAHWNGWMRQSCCEHSASVGDAPSWRNKSAARFDISYDDPLIKGSHRSEFRLKATDFHKVYEYSIKIYIPEDWRFDDIPVFVMQMHNVPDNWKGESGLPPPLALDIVDNAWVLRSAWGRTPTWFDRAGDIHKQDLWTQELERGKWTSWVFRTRWSTEDDGFIEVEKDGVRVLQTHGANCFNNLLAPYFKFGAYAPAWRYLKAPPDIERRVVYITDILARELMQVEAGK